ncbi:phycobilisome rod-core linker polypeptide [Nodularia harveyana UHCC-0300]|uniref:Phycobilisome rod-core linker polypeptide n=1 Tax=Nodularia harveyana UHCC-0300 TaxID=2974287 RepID=A0ABU5U911_9CYAN|nr:phycobilisome rod-core linker polypeptide [Nodularia harveyana]MEA5580012.1 phycobilisome rod-core linker polypeptide [Nodularia harveyana UHCC-0300]
MTIPLLEYKPSSQNQRVAGYEVPNEDTPRIYRIEDCAFDSEVQELIWAAYRQVFSEHEILKFYRQTNLESQVKNRAITVRDFIRGLAKSETFRNLVVQTNSNYRLVEIALKRLLGRASYNKEEEIAWSIKIATLGWDGFVDTLIDSQEYQSNFGENIVPYQRRRYKDRPFNLVTPRYSNYWRDKLEDARYKAGDIKNFMELADSITIKTLTFTPVNLASIEIPDMARDTNPEGIPVSINSSANFPL